MTGIANKTRNIRIRFNSNIGLWAIDRPMSTCTWRSAYCEHCYNNPLYKVYPAMKGADNKNELYWHSLSLPTDITSHFAKRKVKRLRLMSRGEAFKCEDDIYRVAALAKANPNILIWIPTRAWRDKRMKKLIQYELVDVYFNLRIYASIDPESTEDELIEALGFGNGTMFYGNDHEHPYGECVVVKCPKTWEKKKMTCKTCNICFGEDKAHVWLRQH